MCRNHRGFVEATVACSKLGATALYLNTSFAGPQIADVIERENPAVVIFDQEFENLVQGGAKDRKRVIAWADGPTDDPTLEQLIEQASSAPPEPPAEPGKFVILTSGTTGRPKGAVSTNRAVLQALFGFACRAAVEAARAPAEPPSELPSVMPSPSASPSPPVFILIVPLFHVTGCVPVMLSCFAGGVELVMMHRWDPERALQLIERERVTQFVGVPTQSWDLLECPAFDRYDTSSLEKVGGGGAPAPPKLVQRVEDAFSRGGPTIGYGMTETNAYGPQNSGLDYLERPTSTGRATPVLQIEVRDAMGAPLPVGGRGEIWFRGPHLIRGYWGNPGATAETIVDGWLRTGDIGRVDGEGFVYLEDRAKDMILRGGENVYSAEVEAAIYEHPAVYEAAVYGVPHERLGEEVAATVCVRGGERLGAEGLRVHLTTRLAAFKVPTRLSFVTEPLPRNASGKILKTSLRQQAADG